MLNEYLLLSRGQWNADASPRDVQRAIDEFYVWIDRHVAEGRMKLGSRLTIERKLVSKAGVTDGPFVETKEWIGGYWFILAASLEEAAALAAQSPCLQFGLNYEIGPLDPDKAVAESTANETPGAWNAG